MANNAPSVYEITSFTGISDWEDRGQKGSFKFAANADVRKSVDSLSCSQALVDIGLHSSHSPSASVSPSRSASLSPSLSPSSSASPSTGVSNSPSVTPSLSPSLSPSTTPSSSISKSPSPTAGLSTVFQDLVIKWVKCTDGYTYGFGNTGYIYRIDSDWVVQIVYKDADGEIKDAAEWFNDGKQTWLYWATDHKLHRKLIPGNSNWNDVDVAPGVILGDHWPKINLNSGVPHTMRQSGGSLLICNGSWLALVGYDDSYTNEAVDFIPGNISKTLVERQGRAITGTVRDSDPTNGINAMIDSEVPLAQVGDGWIYYSNLSDSIPVKSFPGGGKCNPGGVVNKINQSYIFEWEQNALSWISKQAVGNLAMFAIYDADVGMGGIYSYGRTNKNKPFTLNLDHQIDADELGALESIDGVLLVSYRDGSAFGAKRVDGTAKAQVIYEGIDFKAPIKTPEGKTVWELIELHTAPLPDGAYIEAWYRTDKNGPFKKARTAQGEINNNKPGTKKMTFSFMASGDIYEPRLVLNPIGNLGPEVYRIRTFFR